MMENMWNVLADPSLPCTQYFYVLGIDFLSKTISSNLHLLLNYDISLFLLAATLFYSTDFGVECANIRSSSPHLELSDLT